MIRKRTTDSFEAELQAPGLRLPVRISLDRAGREGVIESVPDGVPKGVPVRLRRGDGTDALAVVVNGRGRFLLSEPFATATRSAVA